MTDFSGVFFTGDRMMTPFYPGVVAIEMMRCMVKGQDILTGTNDGGIEQLVRTIADECGAPVQVIEQTPLDVPDNPGNWVDWDKRHLGLSDTVEFLSIHVDHQDCRETKSALAVLPDERVRLVSLSDLVL